jgi:hypothetical protein
MTISKLIRKGCITYLTYVIDYEKGEVGIENLPIIREIKISIDILHGISRIAQAPHRMTSTELVELKI